jgi:hypothetical protein
MANQQEIAAVVDIILDVFDRNPNLFRESLEEIKVNTEKVTIDNRIEALRKQQREFNAQIEAQIQELLGMK